MLYRLYTGIIDVYETLRMESTCEIPVYSHEDWLRKETGNFEHTGVEKFTLLNITNEEQFAFFSIV